MLTWIAVYNDESHLSQFNADGSENKYKDIDRTKLNRFCLTDGVNVRYALNIHKGQRLIFRRRVFVNMLGKPKGMVYLVGYQFTDSSGLNRKVINYVYENGSVELDDDRNDLVVLPEEN